MFYLGERAANLVTHCLEGLVTSGMGSRIADFSAYPQISIASCRGQNNVNFLAHTDQKSKRRLGGGVAQRTDAKISKYHHGNLREALIGNAVKILEEEGIEALTLRRVARASGVSQAAPYSHFSDKRALITAVCAQGTKWLGEFMAREAADKSGTDYLAGLAVGHIRFALGHPALFRLMSTTDISESISDVGEAPEILIEGYLLMANALAATPLDHFGKGPSGLDIPIAWAQVYGLSNLLIEGRIVPENYGFKDLDSFVVAVLNRFLSNT